MKAKVKAKVAHWYGVYDSRGDLYRAERYRNDFHETDIIDMKAVDILPRSDYRRLKAAERELKAREKR